jgi:hypothetical protein
VNKREQKRIEKLNEQYGFDFVFVNTFDDFVGGIRDENTIPLVLRRKANNYSVKLTSLVMESPNRTFYTWVEHDAPCTLPKEFGWIMLGNYKDSTVKKIVDCDELTIWGLLQSQVLASLHKLE